MTGRDDPRWAGMRQHGRPRVRRRRTSAWTALLCLACLLADPLCGSVRGGAAGPGCASEEAGAQCQGPGPYDGLERPIIVLHSPQPGEEVVGGHVTIVWEVTYFDLVQGYVDILVNDQVVNTPLPIEPVSGAFLEPELTLDGRFGSNVPLEDGVHRIHAQLMDLRGRLLASAAVNITVTRSPARPMPNYTLDGNAQSWSTLLNMAHILKSTLSLQYLCTGHALGH